MDLGLCKVIVMESIWCQDIFDIVDRLRKSDVLADDFLVLDRSRETGKAISTPSLQRSILETDSDGVQ
jgi:hypothetical protein